MSYEAASVDRDPQNNDLVVIGWIAVLLMPLAAIVIGVILRRRGDRRGNPILGVSIATQVVALIAIAVILGGGNDSTPPSQVAPASKDCVFNHKPSPADLRNCAPSLVP
jgi:hypothetical protein